MRIKKEGTELKGVQKFPRGQLQGSVMIHNEEHLYIAPLNNISAGGIFIDALSTLSVGTQVRLVVKSGQLSFPVQAIGKVVRVEKSARLGTAVEFTIVSNQVKDAIGAGVRSQGLKTIV